MIAIQKYLIVCILHEQVHLISLPDRAERHGCSRNIESSIHKGRWVFSVGMSVSCMFNRNSLYLNRPVRSFMVLYLMCIFGINYQVEAQHPGFSYDLIKGILRRSDVLGGVDMTECLLRLEGLNNSDG